jgi:hypothetical protein
MKKKSLLIALVVVIIGAYLYLNMNVREGIQNKTPKAVRSAPVKH